MPSLNGDRDALDAFKSAWWDQFGARLDLGLFFYSRQEDTIYLNQALRGWLGSEEVIFKSEEAFWKKISSLGLDPEQAKRRIKRIREAPDDNSPVQFPSKMDPEKAITIHLISFAEQNNLGSDYGGFIFRRLPSDSRAKEFAQVFDNLLAPARQLTAAVQGNLQALEGNLQAWSPTVVDQFLDDVREDIRRMSHFLDLGLSYSKVVVQTTPFHLPVPLIRLLEDVIGESEYTAGIADEIRSKRDEPLLVKIDQAMVKIALKTVLKEIVDRSPPGMQIDLRLSEGDGFVVIILDSPRMLPLPGLAADTLGRGEFEISPELYLANEILTSQGGSLVFEGRGADAGGGLNIEIRLPIADHSQYSPIHQEWRELLNRGSGRILLAEAQPEYQLRIRDAFTDLGYRVDLAVDGSTALDLIQTRNPKLVILARNLPGMDGLLVTQGVRRWSSVPILMISTRDSMDDLLYAYRLGVDDYLQKPFLIEELVAKAQVFLARQEAGMGSISPEIFQEGVVRIEHGTRQVWVRGDLVDLTPIEYNLLVYLSRHIRQIIPYEQLLENVWEGPEKGTRQGLFVHVRRLRGKIEEDSKNPQIIGNKWGVGYVFNP